MPKAPKPKTVSVEMLIDDIASIAAFVETAQDHVKTLKGPPLTCIRITQLLNAARETAKDTIHTLHDAQEAARA